MKIKSNGSITPNPFSIQQYNNNVDIKCFEIPRFYYGNTDSETDISELYDTNPVDLSKCSVVMRLSNPDDKINQGTNLFLSNDKGEDEFSDYDDKVIVNWIITNNVSDYAGKRTYQLEFYDGEVLAFRTQVMNFIVKESLDTESLIPIHQPTIFEEFEYKLNDIMNDTNNYSEYIDKEIDTKLPNEIKSETSYLQNQINSLASGSPKGTYTNATAIKTANPDTGVYIAQDNGHIYSWTKNSSDDPIDLGVYQGTSISETDPIIKEINLNLDNLNDKYYHKIKLLFRAGTINNTGGDSSNTSYLNNSCRSEYIYARKGSYINTNTVECLVYFFDSSLTYQKREFINGKYYFDEDTLIRIRLYNSSVNINERTTINEQLSDNEINIANSYVNFVLANNTNEYLEYLYGGVTTGYLGNNDRYAISKILYLEPCYIYLPNIYLGNCIKVNDDGSFVAISTWSDNRYISIDESGYYVIVFYNKNGINLTSLNDTKIKKYNKIVNRGIKNTTEIAYHRGLSAFYPENTIPSFGAVKKYGGKYIECDVQVTSDGYMICMHDSTVDRTTSGTGNVADLTLNQIKEFYIENGYQVAMFNNTLKVPTIEDVIGFCSRNGLIPIIELKSEVNYNTLINYLKSYNLYDDAIIISYNLDYLLSLRQIDEHILVALLSDTYNSDVLYKATKLGANSGLDLKISTYSIENIKRIHNNNLFVIYFVSDELGLLEKYSLADYITTNRIIKASNLNWNNEVINYSASGNSFEHTYSDNEIKLFQDVINISGFVKLDNENQVITIGDQTYTPTIIGNWYYIDLTFIKRNSGECTLSIECPYRELIVRKYNYK